MLFCVPGSFRRRLVAGRWLHHNQCMNRLATLESRVDSIDTRLGRVESDVSSIKSTLSNIDTRLASMDAKMDIAGIRSDVEKAHTDIYKWTVTIIAVVAAIYFGIQRLPIQQPAPAVQAPSQGAVQAPASPPTAG